MTILEAIKKAEERQKTISTNICKIYIRRKDWNDLVDPVDFACVYGEKSKTPFIKSENACAVGKESLLANDWGIFTHYNDWGIFTRYFD